MSMWRFIPPPYREGYVANDRFISDCEPEEDYGEDPRFAAKVKRALNERKEVYQYRHTVAPFLVTTTGLLTSTIVLNSPNRGHDYFNVRGGAYHEVGLHTRGFVYFDAPSLVTDVRVTFFRDNAPTGVAPVLADIFDTSLFVTPTVAAYGFNWLNHERFTILYDKTLSPNYPTLKDDATDAMLYPHLCIDIRIPLKRELTIRSNPGFWTSRPMASGGQLGCMVWASVASMASMVLTHDFYWVDS